MKKTGSKFLALLLCLVMVASLMAGAFTVAAEEEGFTAATELAEGMAYLIVTEADGTYYAMTNAGGKLGAEEIAVADGVATGYSEAALWIPTKGPALRSLTEDVYVFAGSGGFMTWDNSMIRTFVYDAASETVMMHTKYWLTFADGAFNQTEDQATACKVLLFAGEAPILDLVTAPLIAPAPAAEREFTADTEMVLGKDYVIVAEADGKYYAMANLDSASYGVDAMEVTVVDGKVKVADTAAWALDADQYIHCVGTPTGNKYIFAGSGGFMTYNGGRLFVYDPATATITMHSKYVLTFADGAFNQSEDASAACKVLLFSAEGAPVVAEDPNNWEGKIDPATVPETDNVETVYREAVKNDDGSIVLAFTSDVHYDGENMNLAAWLPLAEEQYGFIDAMGFCGDMGSAYVNGEAYWDIAEKVMDYVDTQIADGKIGVASYTYGNHEWFVGAGGEYIKYYEKPAAQRLLRNGPAVVTDDYIIYAFGASPDAGFDWNTYGYNTKHMYTMWEEDLTALDTYLASAPTDIPVFITTHYPLHIWGDRQVALGEQIVEVLNKYPNVVLLWGHNHSDKDVNYYDIRHAGDTINVFSADDSTNGKPVTINFDYLAAGTTADKEYTGPEAGSAWTLNKGLIVTIGADGSLKYDYITINGKVLEEDGPVVVAYRNSIDWEITGTEYVEIGSAANAPEIPEIEGYTIVGWDVDLSNIQQPTLATAYYEKVKKPVKEGDPLNEGFVYITLNEEYGNAVGKDGLPIVMFPVPYTEGMTVADAFIKLHEMAYPEGTAGIEVGVMEGGAPFSLMLKGWGYTPAHGAMFYNASGYVQGEDAAIPGTCYYAIAYTESPYEPGMLIPGCCSAEAGETLTLFAQYLAFNSSTYGYDPAGVTGEVYVGTDWNDLKATGIKADEGYFDISFDEAGTYYVVVKGSAGQSAGIVTVGGPSEPVLENTSRAAIVNMLWQLDGEKYANYAMSFSDVEEGMWYTEAIRWAASEGIVLGYDDGTYKPDKPVTREEVATILYRYAQKKGEGFTGSWMFLLPFEDRMEISDWANEAVHWCYMKGIILGRTETTFVPGDTATIEEAGLMIGRLSESLAK